VIISVEKLSHHYGSRTALDEVTFGAAEREVFGLLGPNGSGKSTLFRILATMMAPSGGTARVVGFDVIREAQQVRRSIGVVFQSQSLDRKLTVAENLRAQGHLYGLSGAHLGRRMAEVMERLRLADRARDLVQTLSGGLRRRVEIAKALLHSPKVLLMDEPSAGLDPGARRELWDYVAELRAEQGVTVLLTTHILDEAERCDHILLLHQGKKVAEGTPQELKARVSGDVVALEADDPAAVQRLIGERFGLQPAVAGGLVRVEIPDGHKFIAAVVEALPGRIRSVALHKPTLEDVFLDETGASIC
jgi:ABC-2 type transport system ATP-binding protein